MKNESNNLKLEKYNKLQIRIEKIKNKKKQQITNWKLRKLQQIIFDAVIVEVKTK